MHPHFKNHLQEVRQHYESADYNLAQRRLLDCAIETENAEIFRQTLNFCEWTESFKDNPPPDVLKEKAFALLNKIENAGVKVPQGQNSSILEVEGLGKQYRKSGFKINNLNFQLRTGQITGLVGENGNGKTTLLRLLAAELKPDTGRINYPFLKNVKNGYELKTNLIYIEQRIPRWYGSLMDNLQFTVAYHHSRSDDNRLWTEMMMARLGLRPYRHLTWDRISSGYRTRFELAKTLLRRPKILLLDEPLANLDILSQQTILQDLKFMANSISSPFGMILSSQHIYEVEKVSDNIIFIKNGEPQYQQKTETGQETGLINPLIIELETGSSRESLLSAFAGEHLLKIQFNGGVYMLHFENGTAISKVLRALSDSGIEVNYFRNISQSSRRFFIN